MAGDTSTQAPAPGRQAGTVPEPALRPTEARFPNRHVTRRARVYLDRGAAGTEIVIRDPLGRERRVPAGPGGATRLALEPRELARGNLQGSLALVADGGEVLARFPLESWQPESFLDDSVHRGRFDPAEPDVAAFTEATGLPVTDNRGEDGGRAPAGHAAGQAPGGRGPGQAGAGQPGAVKYWTALPTWFLAARVLLSLVCIAGLIVISFQAFAGSHFSHYETSGTYQVLALVWGAAALALPLLGAPLIARAFRLDRSSGELVANPASELAPHPAGPVTRRFLRTASLRLLPADLVATAEDGVERWLPRSGPAAVTELARVSAGGKPERLELRTADGRPRAALPWDDWFAGRGGEQALADFANAARLRLSESEGQHIPDDDGETFWPYQARRLSPGRRNARYLPWQGLPGAASIGLPVIFGVTCALLGSGSPPASAMAVTAVVISVGPWFVRRLRSRWLDQAVRPGETP